MAGLIRTAPQRESEAPIGQLRWGPTPLPDEKLTFVTGLRTMTTAGDCETMAGMAAHVAARHRSRWCASTSATRTASCSSSRSRARCASAPSSA